jgi:hypothetical protein
MRAVLIKPDLFIFKFNETGYYLKSMQIYEFEVTPKTKHGQLKYKFHPDTDSLMPENGSLTIKSIYSTTQLILNKGDRLIIDFDEDFFDRSFRIVEE